MRINPEDVIQKQYLDEGGFGSVYLATIKLQVPIVHVYTSYSASPGREDQTGGCKDIYSTRW